MIDIEYKEKLEEKDYDFIDKQFNKFSDYLFAMNCNLKFVCMYNKIENCNIYKDFNEVDELIKENIE